MTPAAVKAEESLSRLASAEIRRSFRDQLKEARSRSIANSEDFHGLLYSFERLGWYLSNGRANSLKSCARFLSALGRKSSLCPTAENPFEIQIDRLIDIIRAGRNEALHQGSFARNLTRHAVSLALILEDALLPVEHTVREFMVESPTCAFLWQPLQFIRQTMLASSFSYLPVVDSEPGNLISDRRLSQYLRETGGVRQKRLRQTLQDALRSGELELESAHLVSPSDPVEQLFKGNDNGRPTLVYESAPNDSSRLVGIVMPFDIL